MSEPVWEKIREIAPISPEGLRNGTEVADLFPVPAIGIAEMLGIGVVEAPIDGDGYLDISVEPAQIVVSNRVMPSHQRFTIAHELGHLCLGHELEDWITERQANKFAARLLMPPVKVQEVYELGMSLKHMADYFQVSVECMGHRLRELELV